MSFLAPLFLLGALAVVGPVIFHLIRRTTREKTPFSTLMFLDPTPPRITRRSRLENVWLLLLRCLVIGLLALGFARPFLQRAVSSATPAGAGKRTVILVDMSASMRREKLWGDAQRKVAELLRNATPADEVALLAFDRTVRMVVSFEDWKMTAIEQRAAAATQRLASLAPSWGATHLDAALIHAAELLDQPAKETPRRREIVVVSDLQEGSRLDALQGYEWPRGIEVALEPVRAQHLENASVHWVSEADENEKPGEDVPMRLRVTNAVESKREQFQLRSQEAGVRGREAEVGGRKSKVGGQKAEVGDQKSAARSEPIEVYVPAGQSRIVRLPKDASTSGGALTLTGDDTAFDNTVFLLPPRTVQVPVLFLGRDADDDTHASLYYLRRAFPKTRRQSVEITAHRGDESVPAFQLQQAQLVVLGDGVSGDAPIASAREFARDGKIVVVPLVSAAGAQTVARLLETPKLAATEAAVKDYALLAQIDFQHPIFAPFADPRFSDFTKIHIWKHRRIDPASLAGARVIARFDDGDPAIVQAPLGKGSVVIFTSSWRPADSQFALSSKFVPLLHALLEQSSNLPAQKAQYFVGDEVPLPPAAGVSDSSHNEAAPLTIRKPDGTEVAAGAGSKFTATDQPGIYTVTPGALRFVVNLAPEESRTSPLPTERFTSLGVPLRKSVATSREQAARHEARVQAAELENRQKLWRWLIVAALGVLLIETLFAARLSRATHSHADA
jgi:aerotolerance regulator-like protein/VWA domain-containing protein